MTKKTFFFRHHLNYNFFVNAAVVNEYTPKLYIRGAFQDQTDLKIVDTYLDLTNVYLEKSLDSFYSAGFNPFFFKNKLEDISLNFVIRNMYSLLKHIKIKEVVKAPIHMSIVPKKVNRLLGHKKLGYPSNVLINYYLKKAKKDIPVFIYKPIKKGYIVVPYKLENLNSFEKPLGSLTGIISQKEYRRVIHSYKKKQRRIKNSLRKNLQQFKQNLSLKKENFETKLYFPRNLMLRMNFKHTNAHSLMTLRVPKTRRNKQGKLFSKYSLRDSLFPISSVNFVSKFKKKKDNKNNKETKKV